MKNKHILLMLLATALLFGSTACHKDAQIEPKTPKVTEPEVSFTATTADFGWTVSFPGKVSSVVKLSRHADMSDATSYGDATPTSNKDFHVEITGLSPETQYYYCFEIWNPNLNHRSEVKSFTTQALQKPTVTTSQVTNIQQTSATGGGNVTASGGATVTARGICWSISHNPTIANSHQSSGSGTGTFTANISGLSPGTTYYVRAYAINSAGTSYGSEVSFTTLNYTFQGEGSGTFEDPYNVAAGIGLQSEEPFAWVHGYIVGAVKSGLSSVTNNADINWSAPFDLATNVVIADDVTCREISQCIIVNLPAGKPLRTQVNLMDNPTNLGKHLAVLGKLRAYFGQAGLRDSSGTEDDFVLSW